MSSAKRRKPGRARQDEQIRRLQELDRRRKRVRTRGFVCLAFAVLAGFLALGVPSVVSSVYADETAFRGAAPCAVNAPVGADCTYEVSALVVSKREITGKNAHEFVTVTFDGPPAVEIGFGSGDFYGRLTVGERILVTGWRDAFVRLDDGGVSTDTDGNPSGRTEGALILGLLPPVVAVWAGYMAFWYLRRGDRMAAIPAPRAYVLPARAVLVSLTPLFVTLVVLGVNRGGTSPSAAFYVVPLAYLGAFLLGASSVLFPWMRRPGAVYFKN